MALHILAYPQNTLIADETSQQAVSLQEDERLSKQASKSDEVLVVERPSVSFSLYAVSDDPRPVWVVLAKEGLVCS